MITNQVWVKDKSTRTHTRCVSGRHQGIFFKGLIPRIQVVILACPESILDALRQVRLGFVYQNDKWLIVFKV